MCSWPWADLGNRPTRSIPMRSKGTSMMGSGISGLGGGVLWDVFWQVGQDWQKRLTSASIPGQWKRSRIRWVVLAAPNSSNVSVFVRSTTSRVFYSPPMLRDTVEQAVPDDEMWERMWSRLCLFPLHHAYLSPAVLQTVVLALVLGERTASCHLLI